MSFTYKVVIRGYKNREGTSAVYLRVTINRKSRFLNIGVRWYADFWNDNLGLCKPRFRKGDAEAEDNNYLIEKAKNKAGQVYRNARLREITLTLDDFETEFTATHNRQDLIAFMSEWNKQRYAKRVIKENTYKNYCKSIKKLQAYANQNYQGTILFKDLNSTFAEDYDAWLRTNIASHDIYRPNTAHGLHKTLKATIKQAIKQGHQVINPYNYFSAQETQGRFIALTKTERAALWKLYEAGTLNNTDQCVLRRFLFSCYTGLRISDMLTLRSGDLFQGFLGLIPIKTENQAKSLEMPLSKKAKLLWDDAIKIYGRGNLLFAHPNEHHSNRRLKIIAHKARIRKQISHHVGRGTFATLYLENGGRLEVLQEYLKHSSIRTTRKYVQVTRDSKANEINKIDD